MSFFSVSDLTAGYGPRPVLEQIAFSLEAGKILGILGANGSGKTTLLKAVCGILPHAGRCTLKDIQLEGLQPRQLARLCGYIPQRSGITIDIPALEVVLMGFNPQLGLLEHPTACMREKAREALALAGLAGREQENHLHFSEGQKQLCILARTLVSGSSLLLLDEPESALDFQYRYRTMQLLRNWVREKERAVLAALHDPLLALNSCDSLLVLANGRVQALLSPAGDPPEEMERQLSAVYGAVSLHRCTDRSGRHQWVMLKEPEGSDRKRGSP